MLRCMTEEMRFDYVFGDLPDILVGPKQVRFDFTIFQMLECFYAFSDEVWSFIRKIISLFKILKPNGKYLTHCNGTSSPAALKEFEDLLVSLEIPLEFAKTQSFVPSFLENWVFYQLKRKDEKKEFH